ncbi:MAG: tRNA lysidine(34) synthetase TilS [Holosporaceae bacterium]
MPAAMLLEASFFCDKRFQHDKKVVALSGGPDSLLLAFLMHKVFGPSHNLCAVTVDHALRPAAADEAKHVYQTLATWGLAHHTLKLRNPKPTQEGLRRARYDRLIHFCHQHQIKHLFVAHHQDDQLETLCMRFQKGPCSLLGLGAAEPVSYQQGLLIHRPFLCLTRAQIMHMATACALPFIEDPSNHNRRFERVRMRQALHMLAADQKAFWCKQSAYLMGQKKELLQKAYGLLSRLIQHRTACTASLDAALFAAQVPLMQQVVIKIIRDLLGGPRLRPLSVTQLAKALETLKTQRSVTLGGCVLCLQKKQQRLLITREWQRIQPILLDQTHAQGFVWDGRFWLQPKEEWLCGNATLQPMGCTNPARAALPGFARPGVSSVSVIEAPSAAFGHARWVHEILPFL